MLSPQDAADFERCIATGGVAVFPADTVYGLACDPSSQAAVARLYELKGRRPEKAAAVMFFSLARAREAMTGAGPRTRAALERLLPGPLTLLLPNDDALFPLACGPTPHVLGLRVPELATPLAGVGAAVLQSSANRAGGPDARRLEDVEGEIRGGADLVLDGGELPGTASTVVDLVDYEHAGAWSIVRAGAASEEWVAERLGRGAAE